MDTPNVRYSEKRRCLWVDTKDDGKRTRHTRNIPKGCDEHLAQQLVTQYAKQLQTIYNNTMNNDNVSEDEALHAVQT